MDVEKSRDDLSAATTTCEHEWKLLDVSQETVGRYHDLYYGQGRRIERRRFFCSKCREVTTDESVTKGVGLRG